MVFEENGCAELWPEKWGVSLERSGRQNPQYYTYHTYTNAHTHTQHIFTKTNTNIHIHTPHLKGEMERYGMQNGKVYTHTHKHTQSK